MPRLLVLLLASMAYSLAAPNTIDVMPKPASWHLGEATLKFDLGFDFSFVHDAGGFAPCCARLEGDTDTSTVSKATDDMAILQRAIDQMKDQLMTDPALPPYVPDIFGGKIGRGLAPKPVATVKKIIVAVSRLQARLELGVSEKYSIQVPDDGSPVKITANTVWGALHGLETLQQLIPWTAAVTGAKVPDRYILSTPICVCDQPRFAWRGLLVDVSRHYLPIPSLQRVIDAMAMHKLNALHLHLSDAESFPFASQAVPELVQGAFAPTAVYHISDLAELIHYAHSRGVRVIPELDTPGHTASWSIGFPNITADCWAYLRGKTGIHWPKWDSIPLDLTNPLAWDVAKTLLQELNSVFRDDFVHLGGDEVRTVCWENDEKIMRWMKSSDYAKPNGVLWDYDWRQLQHEWMKMMTETAKQDGRAAIVWEEAFDDNILHGKDTIVQVWSKRELLKTALENGYRVLSSWGWYLDRQAPTEEKPHWMWMWTWRDMYQVDPVSVDGWVPNEQQLPRFLGGEISSWGESVNPSNLDPRLWSRAGAAAERLWSPAASTTDLNDAQTRFSSFNCKLRRRGIEAAPTQPSYCPLMSEVSHGGAAAATKVTEADLTASRPVHMTSDTLMVGLGTFVVTLGFVFVVLVLLKKPQRSSTSNNLEMQQFEDED